MAVRAQNVGEGGRLKRRGKNQRKISRRKRQGWRESRRRGHCRGVNKEKSKWGKGTQTTGFNCSWEGSQGARERMSVCVCVSVCAHRCTHAIAKTWDEAECSSHANEGLGKYSDG